MDLEQINAMVEEYREAVENELLMRLTLAEAEASAAYLKVTTLRDAYERGDIDGKNQKARDLQESAVLAADGEYSDMLDHVSTVKLTAEKARVSREIEATRIGLVKAWLYSQGGTP